MTVDNLSGTSNDNASWYTRNSQVDLFCEQISALRAREKCNGALKDASFSVGPSLAEIRYKINV